MLHQIQPYSSLKSCVAGGILLSIVMASARPIPAAASSFVNFETPTVNPIDLSPDGRTLAVCNLPDNRLELFDVSTGIPSPVKSVSVGLDPVSLRFRTDTEVWVVNQMSDSVSVVDLASGRVVATLHTLDEPADVVFAGSPQRAYVSCSQVNTVQVFDPNSHQAVGEVEINGEDPRAMVVSPDGGSVYVAIFESGNRTTILGGGVALADRIPFPPNVVSDPLGPYGGVNPPPNDGATFNPPMNPSNGRPPRVGLIVRADASGRWWDDNDGEWTEFVSGSRSERSGRVEGWHLVDHDLAIIDTSTLNVRYATGLMNICMAVGVNPATGQVTVVGTDATNQIRFEPNVNGRFLRVMLGAVDPADATSTTVVDLNPHLDYVASTIPQSERDRSIGDPRAIVWNAEGTRAYVAGMGSNNLIVLDAGGNRVAESPTIEVGEGPAGLALDEARQKLYVLNRFDASISVVDVATNAEAARISFFDPTPMAIRIGRKHLYDTHKNSGLGHASCASCHVDARVDRLAWDLGDPAGVVKSSAERNLGLANGALAADPFDDFHPMKGPMMTQTFQDIIGKEPLHWRGDRDGLEQFNPAFLSLMGDDANLTEQEMQEYEDFLATIAIPPNPHRNFDNTLPTDLPLPGVMDFGRFASAGQPLPNGNAQRGLNLFRGGVRQLVIGLGSCTTCHTLPAGLGTDTMFVDAVCRRGFPCTPGGFQPLAVGSEGEHHHMLVNRGTTNLSMKVPQLRMLFDKVGFDTGQVASRAGFGFFNDGSMDTIFRAGAGSARSEFDTRTSQEAADLIAFLLSFSGSDLVASPDEAPGTPSQDTHAAVGQQITIASGEPEPRIDAMIDVASPRPARQRSDPPIPPRCDLVVKGTQDDINRGWVYDFETERFFSDRDGQSLTPTELLALAGPGAEQTYTVVPRGSGLRIGIDRDDDGFGDRTELDAGSDPANAASQPGLKGSNPLIAIMDGLGPERDTFVSPLAENASLTGFTLLATEPLTLNTVDPTYTGAGTIPVAALIDTGNGTHRIALDPAPEPGEWLKLMLEVTGTESGNTTVVSVWVAHHPGDINQDGVVNIRDATAFGDLFGNDGSPFLVDLNGDGVVDVRDATTFGEIWHGTDTTQPWNGHRLLDKPE